MSFTIIQRIADQLNKLIPDSTIYINQVEGGFQEPSFYIHPITSNSKPELFKRQKRSYYYQVVYFPDPQQPITEQIEAMQDLLLDNFQVLDGFAVIRNREFELVDNTLSFTFMVNLRTYPEDHTLKQQTMNYRGGIKNV
ncbi:MAG: hypothetical protein LKJ43_02960 [Lentilactobacillus buchneri]|nr:hypothetical protein [Lentilactobacillus buchneri]MCI1950672.1 hypothetical protein [Lentilactobacillus buchneri]MCI2018251.1 hypothetical protein [Lentilactobacillus buchneri]MCI2027798.1 hypothetical protein [Lentilactobacillus buchneri]